MTTVVGAPDGEIIVDLAPALCTDPAGNLCGGADTLRGVWMDRTPPNVTITTPNPRPTNDTIVLYIEYAAFVAWCVTLAHNVMECVWLCLAVAVFGGGCGCGCGCVACVQVLGVRGADKL